MFVQEQLRLELSPGSARAADCDDFLYALCVLGYMFQGMMAGSSVGGLMAAADALTGVSIEQQRQVDEVMGRIWGGRELQDELLIALTDQLPANLMAPPQASDREVTVRLHAVNFIQQNADAIGIELIGWLTFSADPDAESSSPLTTEFSFVSRSYDIDSWLADEGFRFDEAITEGIVDLAGQMQNMLLQYRSDPAIPEI